MKPILFIFLTLSFFVETGKTEPQSHAALSGPAVLGTQAGGIIRDNCTFTNTGFAEENPIERPAKITDDCLSLGYPAGVCAACDNKPGGGSKICEQAMKKYCSELGWCN